MGALWKIVIIAEKFGSYRVTQYNVCVVYINKYVCCMCIFKVYFNMLYIIIDIVELFCVYTCKKILIVHDIRTIVNVQIFTTILFSLNSLITF